MVCPKCKSTDVSVQAVTHTKLVDQHHGILWWVFVGWWWVAVKWTLFTLPALLVALFKPRRRQVRNKTFAQCVCQSCGHTWKA